MTVLSLVGAASATRNARLQMPQTTAATTLANSGASTPMERPAAMAPPPPRASSFGGVDPRAMFEALVQNFDSDGDGKLSLGEVNALNQGGLLARTFARVDSNGDNTVTGDELASWAPWGAGMLPSDEQGGGERGADARPLTYKLTDHLPTTRDASADALALARRADLARGFDRAAPDQPAQTLSRLNPVADGVPRSADPVTMMESMVLALSTITPND